MAEEAKAQIGENSPEHVAYKLMHEIAVQEGHADSTRRVINADRKYVLDLYAECLHATNGYRTFD
ncbi:MAG: hypothetical protein JJ900_09760 [Rhodospirillales bacterium]|nr:hypothetical protein [Rhodospirillales bacterium]MBO6787124.1 hypothetical protein [Rhodospirillales bacterium]